MCAVYISNINISFLLFIRLCCLMFFCCCCNQCYDQRIVQSQCPLPQCTILLDFLFSFSLWFSIKMVDAVIKRKHVLHSKIICECFWLRLFGLSFIHPKLNINLNGYPYIRWSVARKRIEFQMPFVFFHFDRRPMRNSWYRIGFRVKGINNRNIEMHWKC